MAYPLGIQFVKRAEAKLPTLRGSRQLPGFASLLRVFFVVGIRRRGFGFTWFGGADFEARLDGGEAFAEGFQAISVERGVGDDAEGG